MSVVWPRPHLPLNGLAAEGVVASNLDWFPPLKHTITECGNVKAPFVLEEDMKKRI